MAETLTITASEAANIISILQLQGCVQPNRDEPGWMTIPAGEEVSGSTMPRYTRKSVDQALSELTDRINKINEDPHSVFKVTGAIAFGDFLSKRPRVQAVDVRVALSARTDQRKRTRDVKVKTDASAFLIMLKNKSSLLKLRLYEPWMSQRSHRKIV
jgi:hypothetical protein